MITKYRYIKNKLPNGLKTNIQGIELVVIRTVIRIVKFFSFSTALKIQYYWATKKKLNLNNPQDFNEKIQWLKLYWNSPFLYICADKYDVRKYVMNKGCEEILNDVYRVFDSLDELDLKGLPDEFVIKTSNGSGTNIFYNKSRKISQNEIKKDLSGFLKIDYGDKYLEPHYSKIKPKIIIEKYLKDKKEKSLTDYKFFCFNGIPKFVQVITNRDKKINRIFLDLSWRKLGILKIKDDAKVPPKPNSFNDMIKYAKKLSESIPFVRVDFYDINEKVVFGEMTFTPYGGYFNYIKDDFLLEMGSWIKLPKSKEVINEK